ncbi:MAG: hypothetical protein ACJ76Y_29545 [Thermoanaerobaculia bacterium]
MAGRILEITLRSLAVQKNGEVTRPDGQNQLTVSLIYPYPGKPTVTTSRPLTLGEGTAIDYDAAPYTYADRILLKEKVMGPTMLVVQLTDVEIPSKVTKFMTGLFSSVFSTAMGLFAPGGSNLILAAATHSAAALELDALQLAGGEQLYVIGAASLEIDSANLPANPVTLPLTVPRDVNRDKFVFPPGSGKPIKKEQLILKAGQQNGSITFGIREL